MEAIPHYAFGTAYDIVDDNTTGNNSGDEPRAPVTGDQFTALVEEACRMGCRHFDCAPLYGTQALLGQLFRKIIGPNQNPEAISLARSELFFTSKLPMNMMRPDKMEESLKMTLNELRLGYLDLFLVHAPFSTKFVAHNNYYPTDDQDGTLLLDTEVDLEKTWAKMNQFKEQGLVRLIGLSNVNVSQIQRLDALHHVDVAQNEFHLYNQDETVREECRKLNIHFEGFAALGSPFAAAKYGKQSPIESPTVQKLAKKYNKTPAQILIFWLKEKDLSFVIKSDNIAQLKENLSAGINQLATRAPCKLLSEEDIGILNDLNRNDRIFYYDNHKG